jgi:hypothetical protein
MRKKCATAMSGQSNKVFFAPADFFQISESGIGFFLSREKGGFIPATFLYGAQRSRGCGRANLAWIMLL